MIETRSILDGRGTILVDDCIEAMRAMPAHSVDCVVTSPPNWGLRDYGAKRGRNCSLSTYARLSGRDTPAAGRGLDHPRLDRGLLHQDSLFISERSDGVASYLKRLMSVVGHVAGLKGCLMGEVPVALGPIFKEVNRVCQGDYLPNQSFPLLQIDGANEVCIHSYLTENVGDQQGWRRISTPAKNVFLRFFGFNTCRVKFLREAGR